MRRSHLKKFLAAACGLLLACSLTACGGGGLTAEDAALYVKGLLDETYLGVFDKDYLALVDLTEEEAEETYRQGLEVSYQYLSKNFQFDDAYVTDETRQEAVDLMAEIYSHARYQVGEAVKTGDGFPLEVTVQPIDLIPLVVEKYMGEYSDTFSQKYADTTREEVDALPADEAEAFWIQYENDWAMGVVKLFRTHLGELDHLEPVSLIVRVEPDEEGYYTLSDTDFANLDYLILAYTYDQPPQNP